MSILPAYSTRSLPQYPLGSHRSFLSRHAAHSAPIPIRYSTRPSSSRRAVHNKTSRVQLEAAFTDVISAMTENQSAVTLLHALETYKRAFAELPITSLGDVAFSDAAFIISEIAQTRPLWVALDVRRSKSKILVALAKTVSSFADIATSRFRKIKPAESRRVCPIDPTRILDILALIRQQLRRQDALWVELNSIIHRGRQSKRRVPAELLESDDCLYVTLGVETSIYNDVTFNKSLNVVKNYSPETFFRNIRDDVNALSNPDVAILNFAFDGHYMAAVRDHGVWFVYQAFTALFTLSQWLEYTDWTVNVDTPPSVPSAFMKNIRKICGSRWPVSETEVMGSVRFMMDEFSWPRVQVHFSTTGPTTSGPITSGPTTSAEYPKKILG